MKCPLCDQPSVEHKFIYTNKRIDVSTGKPIKFYAPYYKCSASNCGFEWLSHEQEEKIDNIKNLILKPFHQLGIIYDFIRSNPKIDIKFYDLNFIYDVNDLVKAGIPLKSKQIKYIDNLYKRWKVFIEKESE